MQSVTIIAIGKLQENFFKKAADEYIKRLNSFCKLNIIELNEFNINEKNISAKTIENALEKESETIFNAIPKNAVIISLCIEGKQYSSDEFAAFIDKAAVNGQSHIVFIIGSSHGLSEKIKNISHKFSMGKMTFPHQMARVMLLEQIYRAFSINYNTKYHK